MKRASWEIIRYAPGTGSIPEGDAAAFGGWYADREDAKAQYKMDHSHCPAGRGLGAVVGEVCDPGILSTMNTNNGDELDPTIFSATLTPHRSLGRTGFLILMVLYGTVSFVTGMLFLVLGAWPVFGFFGIDVLLLYCAFRLNYRHAEAYEQVTVTCSELKVRKVSHLGRVREWVLNPLWVKLDKSEIEDFGIDRLFLISRGKKLTIASFLSPDEKADFARELGNALNEARRGPTRTVFDQQIGRPDAP